MAIALTDFEGFCGFRPLREIAGHLGTVREFQKVVGYEVADDFISAVATSEAGDDVLLRNATPVSGKPSDNTKELQKALRTLFEALMNADPEQAVKPQIRALVARYQEETGKKTSKEMKAGSVEELVVRLNEQFPDDVGIFCTYLLNVVTLKPGQACFLEANEPHAYLSGRT